MEAIDLLKNYQKRLAPYLKSFFDEKLKQANKIDPLAKEAVEMIADFVIAGGKRLRPALMYYGHLGAGGTNSDKIVKASMSIELTHTFLLIHDDIIDRDESRHGVRTIHERYKTIAKKIFPLTNAERFGNSMAMLAGDMASSMNYDILLKSEFPSKNIVKALDRLQEIVYVTISGEMVDVVLEARGSATEEDIMRMYKGKTARYTFEGPLHLGASLAGADGDFFEKISAYSIPIGIAFQIRDDILGIFGKQKKLGKPVGSDIIEGKQTILVVKALEMGSKEERKKLKNLLGKNDISLEEIELFREIIKKTGSLDYAHDLSNKFVQEALLALTKTDLANKEAEQFLNGIAQFIIKRKY